MSRTETGHGEIHIQSLATTLNKKTMFFVCSTINSKFFLHEQDFRAIKAHNSFKMQMSLFSRNIIRRRVSEHLKACLSGSILRNLFGTVFKVCITKEQLSGAKVPTKELRVKEKRKNN
uniref:Uncharacterized protein n=1 Tax=Spongospora subterranea TaxID=70186 RepID=A0A0H5RV29_9EUKA|eukprot:CRZ12604.1 hypothetical protein [Spongospora subterranea]